VSHYHGVRVGFDRGGELASFDLSACMSFVAEFTVYLTLTAKLFRFVMVHCLGHLSIIYQGVLNENFHIGQRVAASAVHAISTSLAFKQLAPNDAGLNFQQMAETMLYDFHCFKNLDDQELSFFARFCFDVASDVRSMTYSELNEIKQLADKTKNKLVALVLKRHWLTQGLMTSAWT